MLPGAKCPSLEAVCDEIRAAELGLEPFFAEPDGESEGVGAAAVGKADESSTG